MATATPQELYVALFHAQIEAKSQKSYQSAEQTKSGSVIFSYQQNGVDKKQEMSKEHFFEFSVRFGEKLLQHYFLVTDYEVYRNKHPNDLSFDYAYHALTEEQREEYLENNKAYLDQICDFFIQMKEQTTDVSMKRYYETEILRSNSMIKRKSHSYSGIPETPPTTSEESYKSIPHPYGDIPITKSVISVKKLMSKFEQVQKDTNVSDVTTKQFSQLNPSEQKSFVAAISNSPEQSAILENQSLLSLLRIGRTFHRLPGNKFDIPLSKQVSMLISNSQFSEIFQITKGSPAAKQEIVQMQAIKDLTSFLETYVLVDEKELKNILDKQTPESLSSFFSALNKSIVQLERNEQVLHASEEKQKLEELHAGLRTQQIIKATMLVSIFEKMQPSSSFDKDANFSEFVKSMESLGYNKREDILRELMPESQKFIQELNDYLGPDNESEIASQVKEAMESVVPDLDLPSVV